MASSNPFGKLGQLTIGIFGIIIIAIMAIGYVITTFPAEMFAIVAVILLIYYYRKYSDDREFIGGLKAFNISNLDTMDGIEFEILLERIFKALGYAVKRTPPSRDMGADLIIESNSEKIAVQAKRYSGNVGNKAVQEVIASMGHYNTNSGWVVATSGFTKSAFIQAKPYGIKLIGRDGLKQLLKEAYRNISKPEESKKGLDKLWSNHGIAILVGIIFILIIISASTNP
jgi:restriction system protein